LISSPKSLSLTPLLSKVKSWIRKLLYSGFWKVSAAAFGFTSFTSILRFLWLIRLLKALAS
jgi:hypothetical protein